MTLSRKIAAFALSFAVALTTAGCGGSSDNTSAQAGLQIKSLKTFPAFSAFVNPAIFVENNPIPILKAAVDGAPGSFCSEFCYLKQGIQEAVRQNQELDFFLCLARKAGDVNADVDFPAADGCRYFEITPPALTVNAGPDGISLDLPSKIQVRLCTSGEDVRVHTCGDGALQQELLVANNTDESVNATLVKKLTQSNGCEDKYKVDFHSNCSQENFANGACAATVDGNYCGCYGSGSVNVDLAGGSEPNAKLASDFAAGGLGAGSFGDFVFCSYGDWSRGGDGCFKSQASGSFPAIPSSEVPLASLDGCRNLKSSSVCPNPDFDPEAYDPAAPVCPFVGSPGATCGFDFSGANCCGLTGDTLSGLQGQDIDDAPLASVLDAVNAHACPGEGNCDGIAFEDAWDCAAPAGQAFTAVDLSTAAGIDVTQCQDLLTAVNTFVADENCSEQTAKASSDEIISQP